LPPTRLWPYTFNELMVHISRTRFLLIAVGLIAALHAVAQQPSLKVLELEQIHVSGTRIPADSIIGLSGLQVHAKVNERDVVSACHKITATGLFKTVDYAYDAYPDRPGVTLNLAVADEGPLIPASIIPASDDAAIWAGLETANPIFTRSLPPTEKAIAFYEKAIENYLHANGRPDEYARATVKGDAQGHPAAVVFEIRKYRSNTLQR